MADINEELGRRTLKEFTAEFGHNKVTFVKCDVTKVSICIARIIYFTFSLHDFFKGRGLDRSSLFNTILLFVIATGHPGAGFAKSKLICPKK